jgi:hypothetical protein
VSAVALPHATADCPCAQVNWAWAAGVCWHAHLPPIAASKAEGVGDVACPRELDIPCEHGGKDQRAVLVSLLLWSCLLTLVDNCAGCKLRSQVEWERERYMERNIACTGPQERVWGQTGRKAQKERAQVVQIDWGSLPELPDGR